MYSNYYLEFPDTKSSQYNYFVLNGQYIVILISLFIFYLSLCYRYWSLHQILQVQRYAMPGHALLELSLHQ